MSATLEVAGDRCIVRLEGEVDISGSEELKSILIEALAMRRPLQVEISQASDLDIATIQLLWAAARDAEKSGAHFTVSGELSDPIRNAALEAGFAEFPGLSCAKNAD